MGIRISFSRYLKDCNEHVVWNNNTIFFISMIHEYKVKIDYLLLENPKLFQRLFDITQFEMVSSLVKLLELNIESIRIKKLFYNRSKPHNKLEEKVLIFKEILEEINDKYDKIIIDINFLKDLYIKLSKYSDDSLSISFRNSWKTDYIEGLCSEYYYNLKDEKYNHLDRLITNSAFIDYIKYNIRPSIINDVLLSLLNYLLLLQNGYYIGKYINIVDEKLDGLNYYEFIFNYYKKLVEMINNSKDGVEKKLDAYSIVKSFVLKQNTEFSKSEALKGCPSLGSSSVEIALRKLVNDGILERLYSGKRTKYRKRE